MTKGTGLGNGLGKSTMVKSPLPKTIVKTERFQRLQRGQSKTATVAVPKKGFDGREPRLSGFIYSYGSDSANTFIKTTEELMQFAGTEYDQGDDIAWAYEEGFEGNVTVDRPDMIVIDQAGEQW